MKTIQLIVPDEVGMYSITLISVIAGVSVNLATFAGNVEDKTERKVVWADSSKTELVDEVE